MEEYLSDKLLRTFSNKRNTPKKAAATETKKPADSTETFAQEGTGPIAELETRVQRMSLPQSSSTQSNLSASTLPSTPLDPSERSSFSIQPDMEVLRDLEVHARSISSNIDMALRDLRGSLRGMSDLTLESMQAFSSSINSSCDAVDAAIKSTYSVLAKAEEFNSSMQDVRRLAEQIKDMKHVVDLFEAQLQLNEST